MRAPRMLILLALTCLLAAALPALAIAQDGWGGDPPAYGDGADAQDPWTDPGAADPSATDPAQSDPAQPDPTQADPGFGFQAPDSEPPAFGPRPVAPVVPQVPLVATPTVAGKVAMLRTNGKAAIPRGAPARVRAVIAAANEIVGKPYKWGGGHAKLVDRGYDCSGTVSYALIRSGTSLLSAPLVSGALAKWGAAGAGRWISVYANAGHVYMEVAGLRLDTSAVEDPGGRDGVRWRPAIGRRRGFHTRHPTGL